MAPNRINADFALINENVGGNENAQSARSDLYRKRGKKIEAALQTLFAKQYRSTFQTDIIYIIDAKSFRVVNN